MVNEVSLHVHPLLGNRLVNKFPRRQILGKQSVDRLRNNRGGLFSMSSASRPALVTEQWTRNLKRDTCVLWGPCREDIREYGNGT
jgi:hypothetical protein